MASSRSVLIGVLRDEALLDVADAPKEIVDAIVQRADVEGPVYLIFIRAPTDSENVR